MALYRHAAAVGRRSGVAEFTLKHGESRTARGLLGGIFYTVIEQEADTDGYTTTVTGKANGTIIRNTTSQAAFTNEKNVGDLTVSKTVRGNAGETDREWHFTVTLLKDRDGSGAEETDTSITGTYGEMTFDQGVAAFVLRHGEFRTASGLPAGVAYTVTEQEAGADGYTTTVTGDAEGVIAGNETKQVTFTNEKNTGSLTVSKTVLGSAGETGREWHFTVTLLKSGSGTAAASINGTYGGMTFAQGVARFTLKHGETCTASGLPAGVGYTVTEDEAGQDGYVTKAVGDMGTILTGGTEKAEFTNSKGAPSKTEPVPGANRAVSVGDTVTYEITYENYALETADVFIRDPLDAGITFVSASDGGVYDASTHTVNWRILSVPAGQTGRVTLTGLINEKIKEKFRVDNMAGVQVGNLSEQNTGTVSNPLDNPKTAEIRVTKRLTYQGEGLAAQDAVFYVALFADEGCTERLTEPQALRFANAASAVVTFVGLDAGRTYYVGETDAAGNPIAAGFVGDGILFNADFSQGSRIVTKAGETAALTFENKFDRVPSGFYRAGKLTVTKRVLDDDGEAMNSDETFYAGVFEDPDFTVLSDSVSQNIIPLPMGGNYRASAEVEVVPGKDEALTLYVTETDADGTPVGGGFGYTVTVDKGAVVFSEENMEESVRITNRRKAKPEATPGTEPGTETETKAQTESEEGAQSEAVSTGDDTPAMAYILTLLAAAYVFVAAGVRRKKTE